MTAKLSPTGDSLRAWHARTDEPANCSITTMNMSSNGYVLQRGLSPINGEPFVVIMTMKSSNKKTGNMIQVWILHEDVNPVDAIKSGLDQTICGDCPHRLRLHSDGKLHRTCYVNGGQAPLSIWRAYKRGLYPDINNCVNVDRLLSGRHIRWGGYGDPSVIDPSIVKSFNEKAEGHTGYTHQWRHAFADAFIGIFQASCDSFGDYLEASSKGWKCFSVVNKGDTDVANIGKLCPTEVPNSQAKCQSCTLCDGSKTDIFIPAHGTAGKLVSYVSQDVHELSELLFN